MTTEHTLPPPKMNRREFLTFGTLGALSCILAACDNETPSSGNATPSSSHLTPGSSHVTPSPHSSRPPSPTDADWKMLARSLQGTLVRPDNPQYSTAYRLFITRFDSIRPAAVAYCASPTDVQACLSFVRRFGLPFAPRAGGHSYAGYSTTTGLVLDITRMNRVTVNANTGIATVGAGARLIDVYAALAQYGLVLPAGSCPTVGIAGLTLGGGIGVLGRKFGLTCDNLLAAQVVVADGRILTCDANHAPELFWALRGGGGGNFGVVTSLTFQTHQVSTLSLCTLNWPWANAADVVNAWQNWAPHVPDELWSNCLLLSTSDTSSNPLVHVGGVYVGNTASLDPLLQQLISQVGVPPISKYISENGILETMLIEAGCYGMTVGECHLPSQNPNGLLQRDTYSAKSDYFGSTLPRRGIDILVSAVAQRQMSSTLGRGGILLDACGGAINRVAADATAFVHRDQLFSAQYLAYWNAAAPTPLVTANHSWLTNTWQPMRQYASGTAYQNYIDPDLTDWQNAYYGTNLSRLQRIKVTYDPDNLFHFNQSIPPASGV